MWRRECSAGANSRQIIVQATQSRFQLADHAVRRLVVDISGMPPYVSPGGPACSEAREVTDRPNGREITRIETDTQFVQLSLCLTNLPADDIDRPIESDRVGDVADRGLKLSGVTEQMLVTGRPGEVIPNLRADVPGQGHQLIDSIIHRAATMIVSKREIRSHQESH